MKDQPAERAFTRVPPFSGACVNTRSDATARPRRLPRLPMGNREKPWDSVRNRLLLRGKIARGTTGHEFSRLPGRTPEGAPSRLGEPDAHAAGSFESHRGDDGGRRH